MKQLLARIVLILVWLIVLVAPGCMCVWMVWLWLTNPREFLVFVAVCAGWPAIWVGLFVAFCWARSVLNAKDEED